MKIVDIYGSKEKGVIVVENLSKLNGVEVETVHKKYKGDNAQKYIKNVCAFNLKKVQDNGVNAKLNYDDIYVVTLYDYKKINLNDIKPIAESLKNKGLTFKNHKLKLQKNNSHAGKAIIALSLATIVSLSTPFIIKHVAKKNEPTDINSTDIVYVSEPLDIDYTGKEEESTTSLYLSGIDYVTDESTTSEKPIENNITEPITEKEAEYETTKNDDSNISLNSGNSTKDAVYKYLKTSTDFNDAAIAGIMGNIERECSYDIESTYRESNGYISHGLCQWNAERYENLKKFCGDDLYSVEAQLGFMMNELKNIYTSVYNYLLNVENSEYGARNAALIFAQKYEVCDPDSYEDRQNYAVEYYNQIKSSEYRLSNDDDINISIRK